EEYPILDTNNIPKDVKYALILGGDIDSRTWEIMRLYHQIPNLKIITSGRSILKKISEAEETQSRLISCGVDRNDIRMNILPKDTQEEVEALKKLIGIKPFILVTSAYHLPRSMLLFKSMGVNPIPAPTDFQIQETDSIFSLPSAVQMKKTERAWHEYLGILWHLIKD
ncbi:MAG: YdcF family protein, partial [Sulfurovum sp.]|nr:YdcF family protein [Sulfurovaceae bacterium]